ncbi:MAG: sugar-binding protein [Clostridiales Family XIII bacterium]|jgi:putative multiple sugar transport system substrate-binding protein|nr:sugar-binding protein [Clostridiales Family XIII bacterium]
MRKAKVAVVVLLVAIMTMSFALTGCSSSRSSGSDSGDGAKSGDAKEDLVFITMPTEAEERWIKDGEELQKQIEDAGYKAELTFAQDKIEQQNSDIENAINKGAKIIIIGAKDGTAVGPAVEKAKEAGITVIAYDRLIMDTDAVDYYVTFQLEKVGVLEASYLIEKLGLEDGNKGPFNIELFTGSPDDNNAKYFFKGAWELLQPYFESGVLVSPSGKVTKDFTLDDWQDIAIDSWKMEKAQAEMESRLAKYGGGATHLDAVLSPYDGISKGVINAIEGQGLPWTPGTPDWPYITGQDAMTTALSDILIDKQGETVWKDTRVLAKKVAEVSVQILKGESVDAADTMNNNNIDVPSILLDSQSVTKNGESDASGTISVKEVVDSGYVTADEVGLK